MSKLRKKIILLFVLLLLPAACSTKIGISTSQQSSSAVIVTERTTFSDNVTQSQSTKEVYDTSTKEWGGDISHKPSDFDFNISFCENCLIVDYGKKSVNVYKGGYLSLTDSWGKDWFTWGFGKILFWCTGWDLSIWDEKTDRDIEYCPKYVTSLENIKRVRLIPISEIDGHERIVQKQGIEDDTEVLCWTYDIVDFPKEFDTLSYFHAPTDLKTIDYSRISAQYIDGLPAYGEAMYFGCSTFAWDGVIRPSRPADQGIDDPERINPSQTCIIQLKRARYSVNDTLLSDQQVINPRTCLDEIKNSLMYNPCAMMGHSDMLDIWEKDIEVYCMELVYVALDPNPLIGDESDESHQSHELYLVPAWEVYYSISDSRTEKVSSGMLLINAVTGKSFFSDQYGHDKNTDLYPDLLEPG